MKNCEARYFLMESLQTGEHVVSNVYNGKRILPSMSVSVSTIMTKDPITQVVPSPVREIVRVLIKHNVTGIPLHNSQNKYVGIISRKDIFRNPAETQLAMIMRKPPSVHHTDSIESAGMQMLSQGRRHVAVVNDDEEIVGILTPQNFLPYISQNYGDMHVSRFTSTTVYPIWEETPLPVFFHIVQLTDLYAFPVIDREGKLVGIATDRDIFEHIDIETELVKSESGIADDEDPWSWSGIRNVFSYIIQRGGIKLPERPVKDITVTKPAFVVSGSTISKAIEVMLKGNYNQIPVLEGSGLLQSMLYDIDLLGVFS